MMKNIFNRFAQKVCSSKAKVVANCDHLAKLKFSPVLPNAFTEHGAIMVATVLNTHRAIHKKVGHSH